MIKLKNSDGDQKNQQGTKLKNLNGEEKKLKNSNCYKTQFVTKLKKFNI